MTSTDVRNNGTKGMNKGSFSLIEFMYLHFCSHGRDMIVNGLSIVSPIEGKFCLLPR